MRQYNMSRTLALALVNCDPSGLSDDDLELYNSVDFDFDVIDWVEDSSDINGVCDFSKKYDNCVTIEPV